MSLVKTIRRILVAPNVVSIFSMSLQGQEKQSSSSSFSSSSSSSLSWSSSESAVIRVNGQPAANAVLSGRFWESDNNSSSSTCSPIQLPTSRQQTGDDDVSDVGVFDPSAENNKQPFTGNVVVSRKASEKLNGLKESDTTTKPPESLDCIGSTTTRKLVNVKKYLQNVDVELMKLAGQQSTLHLKLNENHRKTMLRTLFGMTNNKKKIDFDTVFRDAGNMIQNKRMIQFIQNDLHSTIVANKEKMMNLSNDAPYFNEGMDRALMTASVEKVAKTDKMWSYMARGRTYRGNFEHLLHDVAPELVAKYTTARLPPKDSDIFLHMLNDSSIALDLDKSRRTAIERCITLELPAAPTTSSTTDIINGKNGTKKGIQCHQACVDYLKERRHDSLILENVLVKSIQAHQKRTKYVPNYVTPFKDDDDIDNALDIDNVGTGVITCCQSKDVEKLCGEFDALVLVHACDNNGSSSRCSQLRIAEIWEAKATISPTTLHDVITKKIPAIHTLLADKSSSLWCYHNDQETVVPFDNSNGQILLGVFGMELLPPIDAAGLIKAVTCIHALSQDVSVVVQAMDTGFVEVNVDVALERLERIVDIADDFVVVLHE